MNNTGSTFLDAPRARANRSAKELYAAPDGIWYEFHVFKPAQAKENQFAVMFYDVTARHNATQALHESERRLHLALEAGAMGTYVWDPQEDRGVQDAAMMRLFGRDGEIITLREVLGEIIHPDDREWYAATVQKSLDPNGDGKLDTDFRVIHPDGSTHWLHIYGQTIFAGEQPKPVRMHGVAFDITEQKRAE
jgi:PAS domain S-box-containing protein